MPEQIFWDTWAFIALVDRQYKYYDQARKVNQQLKKENAFLVTTEAILTEVGNTFAKASQRSKGVVQIDFAFDMVQNGRGEIISVSTELWKKAYDFYKQRPDKDWGHTDCISFIVMRELGLEKAFTADQHFEQAGFTRLVKPT